MRNNLLESETVLGASLKRRLSEQLNQIASGSYNEHPLRQALNLTFITKEQKASVQRYLYGTNQSTDHLTLQEIANNLIKLAS